MQYFSYLSDDDIRYVHEAALEILAHTGLLVDNEKAGHRFAEHGAPVDHDSEMVRIPATVVEKYRRMVPPSITLRGRDPAYDVTLPRQLPVIATASSAPDIVDPVSGVCRRVWVFARNGVIAGNQGHRASGHVRRQSGDAGADAHRHFHAGFGRPKLARKMGDRGGLDHPSARALDGAADARVRAEFAGMVAGDSSVPEGWERLVVGSEIPT